MSRSTLNKILKRHRHDLKNRPLGTNEAKIGLDREQAIVAEALKNGARVTVCSPSGKKPDMRRKPQDH